MIFDVSNPYFRMNLTFVICMASKIALPWPPKNVSIYLFPYSLHPLGSAMQTRCHFKNHNCKAKFPTNSVWSLNTCREKYN